VNLCLDLIELDPDAQENQEIIKEKLGSLSTKVDSYIAVDDFADSQIQMLKKHQDHISKQISRFESLQKALRNRAEYALRTMGVKSLKSDLGHSMRLQNYSSVEITKSENLPDWAVNTIISKTPNKTKIKEALKSGEKVEGAILVNKESVVFK
jgi:hypothetical protein